MHGREHGPSVCKQGLDCDIHFLPCRCRCHKKVFNGGYGQIKRCSMLMLRSIPWLILLALAFAGFTFVTYSGLTICTVNMFQSHHSLANLPPAFGASTDKCFTATSSSSESNDFSVPFRVHTEAAFSKSSLCLIDSAILSNSPNAFKVGKYSHDSVGWTLLRSAAQLLIFMSLKIATDFFSWLSGYGLGILCPRSSASKASVVILMATLWPHGCFGTGNVVFLHKTLFCRILHLYRCCDFMSAVESLRHQHDRLLIVLGRRHTSTYHTHRGQCAERPCSSSSRIGNGERPFVVIQLVVMAFCHLIHGTCLTKIVRHFLGPVLLLLMSDKLAVS